MDGPIGPRMLIRSAPPGRTSAPHRGLVKCRGPHQAGCARQPTRSSWGDLRFLIILPTSLHIAHLWPSATPARSRPKSRHGLTVGIRRTARPPCRAAIGVSGTRLRERASL